jgi:hypothetical protein
VTTHALDVEEIQTTRGEKALAVVLGIFLLIGLVWAYDKLDTRDSYYESPPTLSAEDQAAIDAAQAAQQELSAAQEAQSFALADLELKRERYRTALDAGRPALDLEREYRVAEETLAAANDRVAAAQARVAATQPAADAAQNRLSDALEAKQRREARLTFFLRLAFALSVLGLAYGLLLTLRGSRYFTLGIAGVGAAAVISLIFAGDYIEDYVEWRDTGPVVLSAAGIALTVAAFWALQRYLQRRIPLRRVRKGECPFCGFPAEGNTSCEGCGRAVAGSCEQCGERRRVGVLFCGSCGEA